MAPSLMPWAFRMTILGVFDADTSEAEQTRLILRSRVCHRACLFRTPRVLYMTTQIGVLNPVILSSEGRRRPNTNAEVRAYRDELG
ncbi:hypothetical protein F4818DRAFT_425622 [Hypoxylon cercidicola]|nr:hypothetical protein F4818DRAFT_425622 [Hypoxylon cercidicola]